MSVVLVTGGAGFIGSAIVRALLARGDRVRVIDNLSTGDLGNLDDIADSIEFQQIDLQDREALGRACENVECVFHQAAIPSVPRSIADPVTSHVANIDGTLNLLLCARDAGVGRVIYASSSSTYGDTAVLPKREDMYCQPISPYAVQKLAGELYMSSFYRVYGLETVSLRYFNVFGPRQNPLSQYSGVLARFIALMLQGKSPTIYGDGEQSRDYTYVENVVQANLLAATAPKDVVAGKVFNVATGQRFTLNAAFEELKKLTGFSGSPIYAERRPGDVTHSLADISAARSAFGYEPVVDFREGLRRTVAWYRCALLHEAGQGTGSRRVE
jgi:nucleoside-diphosphate-sugar epimerase